MTTQTNESSAKAAPIIPAPTPRSLQEELIVMARECALRASSQVHRNTAKLPMPESLWLTLGHVYGMRKQMIERAVLVCERPSMRQFFSNALKLKSLHEAKAKQLAALVKSGKKTRGGITAASFLGYWNKINAASELEFVGALWMIESVLKPGHLLDEISSQTRALKWSGEEEDRQLTYLDELIREFSALSGERVSAGARQAVVFLQNLFGEYDR